ncbi:MULTISPECIES: hypothetical protein [Microbacterium]|uniref:Helix-turn-helix domain-containing protein n=1 Tax=Microbacterium wangchenii TaxID=2541726 RepID=A0ABX5SRE8_9MICO|nr:MULTISPECIES: hypothetical protein [Microbacterium]MCK6068107.1 hypothetical protein [Microbacterium sp. EYE_512]QBR87771.1 hypothetical protein E4K62_03075 [Microbacterium wangchenii]
MAAEVKDAEVALTGSRLRVDVGHVVELSGGGRADIIGNVFAGTGQDAVVALRGAQAVTRDNDANGWRFQLAFIAWMNEHPMMWMWAFVLVIPAIGLPLLARRRRRHRELRSLLEEAIIRYGVAQLDSYGSEQAEGLVSDAAKPAPAAAERQPAPVAAPRSPRHVRRPARTSAAARVPADSPPQSEGPRSFNDLRAGALADREFATLQQFALAAVLEAGYPLATIARLFRVPSWRLQTWVDETLEAAASRPSPGRSLPRR